MKAGEDRFPRRVKRILFALMGLLLIQGMAALPAVAGSDSAMEAELAKADEFSDFGDFDDEEFSEQIDEQASAHLGGEKGFQTTLWALGFTVLAGIMVRFRTLRQMRVLFLLGSVVILGFAFGGCPCPISSFQKVLLWTMGVEVCGYGLVWFLGLIPITYLLGRVWCGWVCHLGALQEFLYASDRFAFLRGKQARRLMRWSQYLLLIALVVQLVITRENLFIHIDPFKVAFNLSSYYTAGWILLGLILVSSLYMYRPFCRAVCPVGLVLGWISRLPGAARLEPNENCLSCRRCSDACPTQAIERDAESKDLAFHSPDCVMCGSCLDVCRRDAISRVRSRG